MVSEVVTRASQLNTLEQLPKPEDAQVVQSEVGGPEKTAEITDWKAEAERVRAEAETLKVQVAKLENDSRSKAVYKMRQDERDEAILSMKAQMEALTKANTAIVSSLARGDTTGIDAEVKSIQSEAARTVATSRTGTAYNALRERMIGVLKGEDGGIDLTADPDMASVPQRWDAETQKANDGQPFDLGVFHNLYVEALGIRNRKEVTEVKRQLAESRKAEKEAKKEVLAAANVNDLTTGGGGSPSSDANVTDDNIDALYMKNPAKYENQYRTFLRGRRG